MSSLALLRQMAFLIGVSLVGILIAGPVLAAPSHKHGVAKLNVAYDKGKLLIELDTPLDGLLGFERAPRTQAEQGSVDQMVVVLQAAERLFRIDPAASCVKSAVEVNSAVLKLGQTEAPGKSDDGHAELQASFWFNCAGRGPQHIEVGLFDAFRRLNRIEVQTIAAKGALKRILTRSANRLALEPR